MIEIWRKGRERGKEREIGEVRRQRQKVKEKEKIRERGEERIKERERRMGRWVGKERELDGGREGGREKEGEPLFTSAEGHVPATEPPCHLGLLRLANQRNEFF